ncbi:DeoR/GlpR family DNA-binding transcription regulator [Agromyces silvae]|uniref:DeoR/GlpR family DNA-binding transcription regulator n=1 Tax=Agromyces silvae TaxID=3388266 RepID=UPI00280B57EE|nr:DeoR/GlpR family DNA-binding transcription regulator [Agromyces protaetiae]
MSTPERFAYGSAAERRDRLARYVNEQGYCTIAELSSRLGVSEMTIRRDIARLVGEKQVRAFHGGVGSLAPGDLSGIEYVDRDRRRSDAKLAIAQHAVDSLPRGSVIGIDAGTTAAHIAASLPHDAALRVVTPSLPAITALAGNRGVELTGLGGLLHWESLSFAGETTLAMISELRLDVLFLAASGLDERGAYCGNGFDAVTKRALIEVADTVVLVADSSKFTASGMVRICDWEAIDVLISDDEISPESAAIVAAADVDLQRVAVAAEVQR